jgi:hypothetical protein
MSAWPHGPMVRVSRSGLHPRIHQAGTRPLAMAVHVFFVESGKIALAVRGGLGNHKDAGRADVVRRTRAREVSGPGGPVEAGWPFLEGGGLVDSDSKRQQSGGIV